MRYTDSPFMHQTRWVISGLLLAMFMVTTACAPLSRTILLPQADGSPSAVVVETQAGRQILDQPFQVAQVNKNARINLGTLSPEQVREQFPRLMALKPLAPERFVVNFEVATLDLTAESLAEIDAILNRALARTGSEIVVVGHTDTRGSHEANDALSLRRAKILRQLFLDRGFPPGRVEAVGRGERELLVPTADEVDEPANRRAEITLR